MLAALLVAALVLAADEAWSEGHAGERLFRLGFVLLGTSAGVLLHRRARRADERLASAESHIAVMSSTTDTLVWESDAVGNLTTVGEAVQRVFGYTTAEALRLNLNDVVHPLEFERLATYVAAGEPWTNERWRCRLKDGTERWFTGSARPRRRADGRLLGYVGITRPLGVDELEEQRLNALAGEVYALLAEGGAEPVFQPILSVKSGRIVGVEALSRFPASARSPDEWFKAADEVSLGIELQVMALQLQLAEIWRLPPDLYMSVNVSPAALSHPQFRRALLEASVPPARLVLEITEHETIADYAALLHTLDELRALGMRVAVDDAGAGYASFRHILRLKPDLIKLDRSLIAGIHEDPALCALATAVVAFAAAVGAQTCAEGIEVLEEFRVLRDLGIDNAQGYLFGRPTADWTTWSEWHREGPVLSSRHRTRTPRQQ